VFYCSRCGALDAGTARSHRCASNDASNKEINGASNKPVGPAPEYDTGKPTEVANPKQRWDRDKYNAYQRQLMRERRAKAKA